MTSDRSACPSPRWPLGAYVLAAAIFAGSIYFSATELPAKIATHFDGAGRANHWSSRSHFEAAFALVGFLVPLLPIGFCYLARFLSPSFFNVPHAEYWRDPAHFPTAVAAVFRRSIWLGAALTAWFAAFNYAVVRANASVPAHLGTASWAIPTVILYGAILVWIVALVRYFSRIPTE